MHKKVYLNGKIRTKKVFNNEDEFGMILNKHPKERGQSE